MSIYGNSIFEYSKSNISIDNILEMFEESCKNMFDMVGCLNEDGTELAIRYNFFESNDSEKLKKGFKEWAKELFDKFVQTVKEAFEKLKTKLTEIYRKTNFVDDFVSKFKNIVTYSNLETAFKNGWAGLTANNKMIFRIASPNDSNFYESVNDSYITDSISKAKKCIEKINDPNTSLEDSKEYYDKSIKHIKTINEYTFTSDLDNADSIKNKNNIYLGFKDEKPPFFAAMGLNGKDSNHYFPTKDSFITTIKMALAGEKEVKSMSLFYKDCVKGLKVSKETSLDNLNLSKWTLKNTDKTNENDQEYIDRQKDVLYCKATYKYISAYILRSSKIVRSIISIIKEEHRIAVSTYMTMCFAIKKYVIKGA